jgi:Fe-S cluster biogenesis protein NfuA/nitrite reductase/ring-hydroxylating ferredoxin subunit
MTDDVDVRATGERIERLLEELREHTDEPTVAAVEELVHSVVELYGSGLARLAAAWPAGDEGLTADPLVESLLLLHGLHPLGVDARIERALDVVRPYLGSHSGGVEYLGVDVDGVAHLRLHGTCDGCASSQRTVELTIEGAVEAAAPEVTAVEVAGVVEPHPSPVLQIGRRPPDDDTRPGLPAGTGPGGWRLLTGALPPRDGLVADDTGPARLVLCDVAGVLYAYLDGCPVCHATLAAGELRDGALACPGCGSSFDLRRAGAARIPAPSGGPTGIPRAEHLEPVPLLLDGAGVHVAVPVRSPA